MDAIQPFLSVIFVMALLGGALYLLRSRGAATFRLPRIGSMNLTSSGPRRMEVLERVMLGPHHALHVVRMGRRSVVVATGPSSCHLLCDLEPEDS